MKQHPKNILSTLLASLALCLFSPLSALAIGPASVNLGSAGNFAILSKSGISSTGQTAITGNIGVSPITASAITGFGLSLDSTNIFSTSPIVTDKIYAADYAAPTPANLTTAIADMQTAYTDASGRTLPTATELGAGNIGGLTIAPGLYKWGTGVIIPTNVTLSGGANDIWIFQIAQTLDVSSATQVILSGGAQASNIFWVVGGQTTLGTTAVFNGNILDQTAIVLNTGATLNGRALSQTAVTLDAGKVTKPNYTTPAPAPVVIIPTPVVVVVPQPVATTNQVGQPYTPPVTNQIGQPYVPPASTNQVGQPYVTPTYYVNEIVTEQTPELIINSENQIHTLNMNLYQGYRNSSVKILQEFLIAQNLGPAARSLARVGATSYFGPLTRSALAEFQKSNNIFPTLGNFGPLTRSFIQTRF